MAVMNPLWSILGFVGTLLIQLLGLAFIYGKLTRSVEVHDKDIAGLKADHKEHDREIGELYTSVGMHRQIGH